MQLESIFGINERVQYMENRPLDGSGSPVLVNGLISSVQIAAFDTGAKEVHYTVRDDKGRNYGISENRLLLHLVPNTSLVR